MTIINQIINIGGSRWKIREAVSIKEAIHAIAAARVSGSVGSKHVGSGYYNNEELILADVVRVNSDGTEHQPKLDLGKTKMTTFTPSEQTALMFIDAGLQSFEQFDDELWIKVYEHFRDYGETYGITKPPTANPIAWLTEHLHLLTSTF